MRFRDEHKLDYHLFIARGSGWIWWGCFSFITELRPEQSCWLSALVNFSFSFNTIFLSGQGLMAAEWTPFGVSLAIRNQKLKRNGKNGWTKITLTSPLKNVCGKGLLAWHYCHRRETITKYENKLVSKSNLATALCVCLWCSAVHILYCVVRIGSDKLLNIRYKFSTTSVQTASCRW